MAIKEKDQADKFKQTEFVDVNIPQSEEKELFLDSIRDARKKLDEAVTKRLFVGEVRPLAQDANRDFFKAISIYSLYMANGSDDPVPKFISCVNVVASVANSISKVFLGYDDCKKTVNEIACVISKAISDLDKLLDD
jgi:hypothetical protein